MNPAIIIYSVQHVIHRKLRSWLTVLSVLVGITAIFALLSFGIGIQNYVVQLAEEAGADKLFLTAKGIGAPGTDGNFFVVENDVDFISKINGVKDASGIYIKAGEITFKKQKKQTFVLGLDMSKQRFVENALLVKLFKGRSLKENELDKVVLGYNYLVENKIFSRALDIGDKLSVNGRTVEVVGFYDEIGNPSDDANVYVNYKTMETIFSVNTFGYVILQAHKGVPADELAERVQDKLRKFKNQEKGKEDFFVQTFADVLQTFGSVIIVINGVLVLIALVSIVVASVNIMNTMYTAVLERTREIGVMKAIGAQNRDILLVFVVEAGLLSTLGGILGVVLGYGIASAGGAFAAASGFASLQPAFPAVLVVGCILFAFMLGAVSGYLPARQAARLNATDALRYE
ncbi:ABC transporter permease [Candidatus Woesearchaeota archaeon]|nr:ABC transporter permease [Candidatus Woesearchaeota archaeon]